MTFCVAAAGVNKLAASTNPAAPRPAGFTGGLSVGDSCPRKPNGGVKFAPELILPAALAAGGK